MVKEVGADWVSLCWKRPDVKRTTAPFLMYKVEAWLCGEGAYWVEVGRSPIPQFDIFNLKPKREYYFRQASLHLYVHCASSPRKFNFHLTYLVILSVVMFCCVWIVSSGY